MAITYEVAEVRNLSTNTIAYTAPAGKTAIILAAIVDNSNSSPMMLDLIDFSGNIYFRAMQIPSTGKVLSEIEGQIIEETRSVGFTSTTGNVSVRLSLKVIDNV